MNENSMQTRQTENLKKNFGILGISSLLYACFYALCMYKNKSGITYPFFLAGSLWFYSFYLKKLEISLKKDSIFYVISILLLGISTFCTADGRIIAMNKAGAFVLTISFLLHQFFEDANWTFGRYVGYVIAAFFGSFGEIARPFSDMIFYRNTKGKKGKGVMLYIVIGLCFGIPLIFIIWLLLMSADMIFRNMTEAFFETLNIGNLVGILFTVTAMFFLTYCMMAFLCKKPFFDGQVERKQTEAALAITVTLPLTVLYMIFSGVQIVCLFFEKINLEQYTYAEYARQGFFQLLAVCVINLVLVLLGRAYFKENIFLKTILTVMSLCTYVMIASSAYRMILYIKQYYLTFLRFFVLWFLVVLFILLTGVVASIFHSKFPLFRYSMVVVTVCYLLLSFAHPDYWIAKCNIANMGSNSSAFFEADAYEDYYYMTRLSADAAPALADFFKEEGFDAETVEKAVKTERPHDALYGGFSGDAPSWGYYYMEHIYENYLKLGIRNFNLSRYFSWKILK